MLKPLLSGSLAALLLVVVSAGTAAPAASDQSQAVAYQARMSKGVVADLAKLPASQPYSVIVHFRSGTAATHRALVARLGLRVGHDFERYAKALYLIGPVSAFQSLSRDSSVSLLEEVRGLSYMGDTANWATRVRVMQEPVAGGPYYDPTGGIIDGTGVGIAIVDSGVNTPHPDFAGHVAKNFKVTCPVILVDEAYLPLCQFNDLGTNASSDTTGGHGTHCAGIALGNGAASDGDYPVADAAPNTTGTYTGVAPKASLYAFGAGETTQIINLNAAASFDWILKNNETLTPKIRVVSNSYGGDGPYDPEFLLSKLARQLADHGVVVVWAAGNDGGAGVEDGTEDPSHTSSSCRIPGPGILCVANYNDIGSGARDSVLDTSSSRAAIDHINEYPDIAAPGANITATCSEAQPGQAVCASGAETNWAPSYGTISGTSMATPHVAGIVALIAQAKPDITPAEIENVIKDTARKVMTNGAYIADPANPDGSQNFGLGAGLIDVPSIMNSLGIPHGVLPVQGAETTILDGDADDLADGAADVIKLTMQEGTEGGLTGITYRLTLRDATEFAISGNYALRVLQNVNGVHFSTQVDLSADGVALPEAGADNNAVATHAELAGNVLSFFVPYVSMAFPERNSPVHNIRVQVIDLDSGMDADYAPSPADVPAALASARPMFGRPFTIQLPAGTPPPINESACVLPGLTLATSPAGVNGTAGLPTAQDDLRQIWFAEPTDMPGKLVVTLKMDNLSPAPPPGHRWSVYLRVPGDNNEYFVALDTSNGPAEYNYGTRSALSTPAAALGTFDVIGDLDAASRYDVDGTIHLVIDKASWPTPITTGMELTGIAGSIRESSPSSGNAAGLTADSAGATRSYTVNGNVCAVTPPPVEPPPVDPPPVDPPVTPPVQPPAAAAPVADGGRFGGALGGWLLLPLLLAGWRRRTP